MIRCSFFPFQEGLSIVENRTADIIQETRRLNIGRKGNGTDFSDQQQNAANRIQTEYETQLKASRDVRCQFGIA